MALYADSYSRVACAPTKLAEYLGCGVPCLGSAGVGDMHAEPAPWRPWHARLAPFVMDDALRAAREALSQRLAALDPPRPQHELFPAPTDEGAEP